MILVLNGYPGTGKLTIAQALAPMLGARLLDIHTTHNLAFALTEFRSDAFYKTVDRVEAMAFGLIRDLPRDVPVVLTTVLAGDGARALAEWEKLAALGRDRPPFLVVHIACDLEENLRRVNGESRVGARKPRDPGYVRRNHAEAKPLMRAGAERVLELDTTGLSAEASAAAITDWARG
ncbi:AAA family ATPase [Gymnodinialimonas hymeniacidonis]|uniref:AAA family ATPase n=1 Tax=Gymnodinialimonas hymeniacidonis TaxID=3126508 RepID=UPI0034C5EB8D